MMKPFFLDNKSLLYTLEWCMCTLLYINGNLEIVAHPFIKNITDRKDSCVSVLKYTILLNVTYHRSPQFYNLHFFFFKTSTKGTHCMGEPRCTQLQLCTKYKTPPSQQKGKGIIYNNVITSAVLKHLPQSTDCGSEELAVRYQN